MDETMREHYTCHVADICKQLAAWEGDAISEVDGNDLPDMWLTEEGAVDRYRPQNVREYVRQFMDVSFKFVFYHCDLGPGNIIVDPARGLIGIIDWATAGYVPKAWVRTKFGLCPGLDLESVGQAREREWRNGVAAKLGEMGFPDAVETMHFARYGKAMPSGF
jgi:hypothetical protein